MRHLNEKHSWFDVKNTFITKEPGTYTEEEEKWALSSGVSPLDIYKISPKYKSNKIKIVIKYKDGCELFNAVYDNKLLFDEFGPMCSHINDYNSNVGNKSPEIGVLLLKRMTKLAYVLHDEICKPVIATTPNDTKTNVFKEIKFINYRYCVVCLKYKNKNTLNIVDTVNDKMMLASWFNLHNVTDPAENFAFGLRNHRCYIINADKNNDIGIRVVTFYSANNKLYVFDKVDGKKIESIYNYTYMINNREKGGSIYLATTEEGNVFVNEKGECISEYYKDYIHQFPLFGTERIGIVKDFNDNYNVVTLRIDENGNCYVTEKIPYDEARHIKSISFNQSGFITIKYDNDEEIEVGYYDFSKGIYRKYINL